MEVQITNHAHQRFKERGYSKSQQKIQNAFDKAWSCGKTIEDFKDHSQKKYLKNVRDARRASARERTALPDIKRGILLALFPLTTEEG